MHTILGEDGQPFNMLEPKSAHLLIDIHFSERAGNRKRWAMSNMDGLTLDGTGTETFDNDNPLILESTEGPPPPASILDEARFSIRLRDHDFTWDNRLRGKFSGTEIWMWLKWRLEESGRFSKAIFWAGGTGIGDPRREGAELVLSFRQGLAAVDSADYPTMTPSFFHGEDPTDNAGRFINSSQDLFIGGLPLSRRYS